MSDDFLGANPILPVKSVDETLAFFHSVFGFEILVRWETRNYGVVKRGATIIEFGEERPDHAGTGVCNIHVHCADTVYDEWKSRGATLIGDLADRDYGRRDFRVSDNNGNTLIVGHDLDNCEALIETGNTAG